MQANPGSSPRKQAVVQRGRGIGSKSQARARSADPSATSGSEAVRATVAAGAVIVTGPAHRLGRLRSARKGEESAPNEADATLRVPLDPAEAPSVVMALLAEPRTVADSALALGAVIAAARDLVAAGQVALAADAAGIHWRPVIEGKPADAIEAAVEAFIRTTALQFSPGLAPENPSKRPVSRSIAGLPGAGSRGTGEARPSRREAFETVRQFAEGVACGYARRLPLPEDLNGMDLAEPVRYAINQWAERALAREAANGARLVLTLDPPDAAEDAWLVTAGIAEGATDTVHELRQSLAVTIPGADEQDVARLTTLEIAAAREISRVPGLFISYYCELTGSQLVRFCDSIDAWAAAGIEVRTPKGFRRRSSLRTRVSVSGSPDGMVSKGLALDVQADVDGRQLSSEDMKTLAAACAPFVKLGSEWIQVPPGAAAAARLFARAEKGLLEPVELLDEEFDEFDVSATDVSGWVGQALRGEATLSTIKAVSPPAGLTAELRHYQLDGLAWLTWCEANNVGGILADDMGLGKTIQILARTLADHRGPTLIVCPTTLMDNWCREAAKFTPELRTAIYHGTGRDLAAVRAAADIVVTTYALLAKDPALRDVPWHRVILDEAQAIKNPSSRAAQAARRLSSVHRFAVTGTPVENHLGDLWALSSFATPGLLGSFAKFRRRYLGVDARLDSKRIEALRAVVSPFLLRRTKNDKSVAPDLPDKIEIRRDCAMTREQVGLYEAVVQKLEAAAASADGTKRRGLVLAGLTKLKQACVHPQLASGTHERGLTRTSGKLIELIELITEAAAEGDAVIVFSQYASFLAPLADFIAVHAGVPTLRLDGSMTRLARTRVVDRFTDPAGPPVLLASLKAGGTGLNLVRASHVIHLDRWWNPAVEDQGSDRAWRIGQKSTVMVHTLVCPGTVEERIAALLARKRETAAAIVSAEAVPAVTELSATDLHELISLVQDEHTRLRSS